MFMLHIYPLHAKLMCGMKQQNVKLLNVSVITVLITYINEIAGT